MSILYETIFVLLNYELTYNKTSFLDIHSSEKIIKIAKVVKIKNKRNTLLRDTV